MQIDLISGLLSTAYYLPSPNYDYRPPGTEIDLLVIHSISLPPRIFGGNAIDNFFCNILDADEHPYFKEIIDLKVSAHLLIRRNGRITQYVPFHLRAWHAGVSSYKGRENCNDFSVGIELEGADDVPYTHEQYYSLANTTQLLMKCYPSISPDRIIGHSDIAPGRKQDPGSIFNWDFYRQLLEKEVCI